MAISPDARFVAVGSLLDHLRGHGNSVYSVAFTPEGKGLVSCLLDSSTWSSTRQLTMRAKLASGLARVCWFTGHKDYVLSVAVSHEGQWVVSCSKDHGGQFWDKNRQAQLMLEGHKNSGERRMSY